MIYYNYINKIKKSEVLSMQTNIYKIKHYMFNYDLIIMMPDDFTIDIDPSQTWLNTSEDDRLEYSMIDFNIYPQNDQPMTSHQVGVAIDRNGNTRIVVKDLSDFAYEGVKICAAV